MHTRVLYCLFLICFLSTHAWAQEIQINESPQLTQLMKNWVNNNRVNPKIDAWRVQLMASTDRQQIEDGKNRFKIAYPDVKADWVHEKPYYKLRAGAFRTKQESLAFIGFLYDFPEAYPVKDAQIHPRDFLD